MAAIKFNRIPKSLRTLNLDDFPLGQTTACWVQLITNGLGEPIRIPVVVARGSQQSSSKGKGQVLGITAALHGNELNGIRVIQSLFEQLDPTQLTGTVVGVMAVNVPGVLLGQRNFNNGIDLNRVAPGRADGNESDIFMHRFIDSILKNFNFLIDLHTASTGRINSFYVRANLKDPETKILAMLQNAEVILHNAPSDATLRGAASSLGITAVTLELQDPGLFQDQVIASALHGLRNVLTHHNFLQGIPVESAKNSVVCEKSTWLYTDEGGILFVPPDLCARIQEGQKIAEVRSIFGEVIREYFAPTDGIVIGKSINPINQAGSRILHLGTHIART